MPTDQGTFLMDQATAGFPWFGLLEAQTAGRQIPEGVAFDKVRVRLRLRLRLRLGFRADLVEGDALTLSLSLGLSLSLTLPRTGTRPATRARR